MKLIVGLILLYVVLGVENLARAQDYLNGPESIAFDTITDRWIVSNFWDGKLIAIDDHGVQSEFKVGLNRCCGNVIDGDLIYVALGQYVCSVDLNDSTNVEYWNPAVITRLDGVAVDTSGNLYVVDWGGRINTIRLSDDNISILTSSGLGTMLQDITFDAANNRLLLANYEADSPIRAISLVDTSVTSLVITPFGFMDGITIDDEGNVYVSSRIEGRIYRYDTSFTNPPELIAYDCIAPTGLHYNDRDNILGIPSTNDAVILVDLSQPDIDIIAQSFTESSGNGDGSADEGEAMELNLTVKNHRQNAENAMGILTSNDPYITVTEGSFLIGDLPWGGEVSTSTPLEVVVSSPCPDPHTAVLEFNIAADEGYNMTDTILIFIGDDVDFSENCEGGIGLWHHQSGTPVHKDSWHLENYRAVSGSYSWKIGSDGSDDYPNYIDGILISPPFMLSSNSILTFQHWIEAEAVADSAKDGGTVFLKTSSGEIHLVEPVGGYPDYLMHEPYMGLPSGTPCYSRSFDWQSAEFDLSAFSGVVQLMFRFCSNSSTTREGWYIDDINVIGEKLYICGDANEDKSINVGDVVFLVNLIFHNGPLPNPKEAGDVNCDGSVNVGDAVFMTNYIFQQDAPVPCADCP